MIDTQEIDLICVWRHSVGVLVTNLACVWYECVVRLLLSDLSGFIFNLTSECSLDLV